MNPILIVDDNEQIVEILSRYIAAEGWPLLCARSGEEALSLFDAAGPVRDPFGHPAAGHRRAGGVPGASRRVSGVPILMITARDEDAAQLWAWTSARTTTSSSPFPPAR